MQRIRELSTPYNPQQNGIAERKNRTIMEATREIIHDQDLPMHLWVEAARTTVYVQNYTPHRLLMNKKSQGQVSTLSSFLQSCIKLLRNQNALNQLQKVIQSCEPHQSPESERVVSRVRRTGREMRLHAQVGEYDMKDIILDLGS